MRKTFDEALGDLLAEYSDRPLSELASALELQKMALEESEQNIREGA